MLGGEARAHGIERIRLLFPSLPLLIYTELAPATASVLLQLGRAGISVLVTFTVPPEAAGRCRPTCRSACG